MTLAISTPLYTPQMVAQLSEESGKLYELVEGTLVEKEVSALSNWIAGQILFLLRNIYSPQKAMIFVEQPTYCFADAGQMRRPDVALVWTERLPNGLTHEELEIAPDLVIEVISPTNTYNMIADRQIDYLDAGVGMFWIVEPDHRRIHVYRKDGSVTLLKSGDVLKDEPLLPELTMKVADCFPPISRAAKA